MKSMTSYYHRFIRFKNVDENRRVLLENAVERYLVALEDGDNSIHLRSHNSKHYKEVMLYSTLQEDTVSNANHEANFSNGYRSVPTPQFTRENYHSEKTKNFTLLMVIDRQPIEFIPGSSDKKSMRNISIQDERGMMHGMSQSIDKEPDQEEKLKIS